ncbi:PREDICTED: tRNA(adenine(34)) deaminase, chloroplastic isoform X2 [Ipomoea nil]|uniref:tRNA(adenine(34)) deaminase, chloroplastic isoform X2 n=1 Tax=Ipomoea nil TaxID=35883 RepID=UPI000900DBDD|nr:PREDICTED: tRNA(adenine(34)) deaminase, chloroplastic isoform X2 [Ipomoea nil]
MYNTCVSSTLSLKCDGGASFSFNGYAYCTKNRFSKYPLCNSQSCCCYCCCSSSANSMHRVPLGPSYACGLRQSTLIQWSPCKKMILRSLDRCNASFPGFGIERKLYYEKSCSLNKRSVCRRRERYGCMGFQEESEMPSLCDVDEAEVLLSLLCEDLDEECVDFRGRKGRSWEKRVVEIKENNSIDKKKGGKFGDDKKSSEVESMVCVSMKEDKIKNEHRREKEKDALPRGEKSRRNAREVVGRSLVKQRVRGEDNNEALLSGENQEASVVRDEREYFSRKSNIERERREEERGEDLSRREDHRQKVRKEGSSCSSYYSLSSTGELDSDNEMQIQGELSNKNGKHSRSEEFTRYGEVGERVSDCSQEQGMISSKEDTLAGSYVASADIDGSWRKKSEKRLTDISIEDRKESSRKQSRISGVHESNYGKELSSSKAYDDRKQKLTSTVDFDQSETRMKHKQFLEMPANRDPTETMTRMEEARDENRKTDIVRREDESGKHSQEISKSQIQEVDVRGAFTGEIESSVRRTSGEVSSSRGRSSTYITDEKHNQARDEHILSTYISERKSKTRLTNQEEYKTYSLKSSLESRGESSQTNVERTKSTELLKGSEQTTALMDHSRETYGEVKRGETSEKRLEFVSPEDGLGSANRLQKYSAEYVGEFVEKVRHEVSSSEIEKRSSETKLVYEGEQESQSKEQDSTSSLGSRAAGPSDEMWVTQTQPSIQESAPSIQETPGTELKDDTETVGSAEIKRTGQSMWHIIADIVRMRWISRSGKHASTSGSGGTSSSHHSNEAQISGHVPEGSDSESVKKEKRLLQKSSSEQHKQEKVQIQSQGEEVSNLSTDQIKPEWEDASSSILPSSSISLASNEETLQKTTRAEQAAASSSSTEQVVPSASTEISIPEVKDGEVRQRKFQRANQMIRDRFDEWEEAYRTETEQRKVDEMFMREALREAQKAASNWEVPVGAVLVQGGKIIARGCNLVEELRDSTAHAEMICIREASNVLRSWRLSDTTLYITLEPCPMCAGAILQARIDTVVWGAPNKLLGADGSWIRLFPDGDGGDGQQSTDKPPAPVHPFHPNMSIRRGVLALECADAMQQFFQLRRKKEKKSESPPSRLPLSRHPNKLLAKMHDAFHLMFCL